MTNAQGQVDVPKVDEFEELDEETWLPLEGSHMSSQYWSDDWDKEDAKFTDHVRNVLATSAKQVA